MKKLLIILTLGLLLMPTLNAQPPVNRRLRIMVASSTYSNQEVADLVHSRLIASLTAHCGSSCVVVEAGYGDDDPKYDATLTGSWSLQQPCTSCAWYMTGSMRLVDKDGTVLWSDNIHSHKFQHVTADFANETAKRLVKHLAGE